MPKKTEGVYRLVQDVLQTFLEPYSEDVIGEVCRAIEWNPVWYRRYEDLIIELDHKNGVVHNWIGRYTKEITGLRVLRRTTNHMSTLIRSYTKLTP